MDRSSSGPLPPSGRQHVIAHGTSEVVVTEVGATLRSYTMAGGAVVDGFGEDELCSDGRGQVLAPWPNRLGDGRYRFGDRQGRAAWDEPQRRNAIHGLVRWLPWELRGHAQNSLTLGCLLEPQPGYPWRIALEVEYHLGRSGLTVRSSARNLDEAPAPFGLGFHPYLTVGTAVDEARLRLVADRYLRSDDRGLPVGEERVSGSELDFRVARPIGPTRLDTAYAQLTRHKDGMARVELRHPDGERRLVLWMDGAFGYVMVYSGDAVAAHDRRRRALAVEPMTCPPDALRSGTDLVTLAPGTTWNGTWGITPTPSA